MPEVISCPQCQKKLRVPEELLGQEVRCPTCNQTFTAEVRPPVTPPAPEPPERDEEPVYRPLDEPRRRRAVRRFDDDDDEEDDRPRRRRSRTPHRGGSVLTLGILGLVFAFCCCLIGLPMSIAAVSMGSSDLSAMRRGDMDVEGQGSTQAGVVCGWIGIVVSVLNGIAGAVLQGLDSGNRGPRPRF